MITTVQLLQQRSCKKRALKNLDFTPALYSYCFLLLVISLMHNSVMVFCEKKSEESKDYSLNGHCIKDQVDSETVIYAFDYCPSSYSSSLQYIRGRTLSVNFIPNIIMVLSFWHF